MRSIFGCRPWWGSILLQTVWRVPPALTSRRRRKASTASLPCRNSRTSSIAFDATSAGAHHRHFEILAKHGVTVIDLTPAAIGPFVVPVVNLDEHLDAPNINMVTCGGQATIPIVKAVSRVTPVQYAEIVASISSRSAGPGTRANIDEFTETTSRAIETVGGAKIGKAIIVLNPAEPPLMMRDTVYCLVDEDADREKIEARYTRWSRTSRPTFQDIASSRRCSLTAYRVPAQFAGVRQAQGFGLKVSVFIEVEGAAHYLPSYAGNLDIMTSAAVRAAEHIAATRLAA